MSNSELSADHSQAPWPEDDLHELKSILDTIAAQLTDADRRHSASLTEMQERIAGMGQQADTLRHRVPEQFAPAFARIEIGMAELAQRLAGGSDARATHGSEAAPYGHSAGFELAAGEFQHADCSKAATPMALRSAHESTGPCPRWREDDVSRRTSNVDTFDVIESRLPGDATDPWDRQSAEALAGLYESGAASFAPKSSLAGHLHEELHDRAFGHNPDAAPAPAHANDHGGIDEAWLDRRLAEIAKGIEQSLAHINPDHGFKALGQRLDHFEHQVAKLLESVASTADIVSVEQLEAHVGEVVNQLVQTQDQLARLNAIEEQLAAISQTLADVQGGAGVSAHAEMANAASAVDVDAIARAAAEETAHRLTDLRSEFRHSAADELRPLIERLMSESREGEEHTAALLDTMQQAMIRLLDRVDSIEFSQRQNFAAPGGTLAHPDNPSFADNAEPQPDPADDHPGSDRPAGALDAAAAAIASAKAAPVERASPPKSLDDAGPDLAQRNNDQRRADLIADARRAKMRLAAVGQDDSVIATPAAVASGLNPAGAGMAPPSPGSRPIRPSAAVAKSSGPSGPSPRLMIVAVAAVLALGGLWYKLGRSGDRPVAAQPAVLAPLAGTAQPQGAANPSADGIRSGEPAPGSNGPRSDMGPQGGTVGQIIPGDAPAGRTTLPMLGVAVDVDQPVTASGLQQAKRHQAMATMSGEIGEAVARQNDSRAVPASMVPTEAETEGVTPQSNTLARSTPLDMPAASVGPFSLRLAAANGDPSAEFEVGARLAEGKGTAQNFKDAAKWYQRSADHGFAQAQYRLGTLYERGLGLKPDRALAAAWYKRAADEGNIKAMHNLAVLSANQNDQSPDYTTAAQWFEEAAKRGLADSQFNLAVLYENGLGVNRDLKQAFLWLSLAARDGDADAVRRRDILRGKLTADEITAAERMIATWKALPFDRAVNDARTAGEAWKKNPKNGVNG